MPSRFPHLRVVSSSIFISEPQKVVWHHSALRDLGNALCGLTGGPFLAPGETADEAGRQIRVSPESFQGDVVSPKVISEIHDVDIVPETNCLSSNFVWQGVDNSLPAGECSFMNDEQAKPPSHFIAEWRKVRDITLEKLAEKTELDPGHLNRVERGEKGYTEDSLKKIAAALDVTLYDLFISPHAAAWPDLANVFAAMTPEQRKQLLDIANVIAKGKTG